MFLCKLLPIILLLSVSCLEKRAQQTCTMENEYVLSNTLEIPKVVKVLRIDKQKLFVSWSVDKNTWSCFVNNSGIKLSNPIKITRHLNLLKNKGEKKTFWPAHKDDSIDAETLDMTMLPKGDIVVGIIEQPVNGKQGGVFLAKINSITGEQKAILRLDKIKQFAQTISIVSINQKVIVSWHDKETDDTQIKLALVDTKSFTTTKIKRLQTQEAAFSPSLSAFKTNVLIAWTQVLNNKDNTGFVVNAAKIIDNLQIENTFSIAKVGFFNPSPILVPIDENFGLAFRDNEQKDEKPGFYFAMLSNNGEIIKKPTRISKADGFQGPQIFNGKTTIYSAQIRSYQRNFLIGFNRFNYQGVKNGGEFQIYADNSNFIRVDLDVNDSEVLVVYAEDKHNSGRILASKINCK